MKKLFTLVALILVVTSASAQLKFGLKGGVNITSMSFNAPKKVTANNRTGFYIGPTMKFITPGIGLGFDLSLLYDQRQGDAEWNEPGYTSYNGSVKQQQISVPINLRWEWDFGEILGIFLYGGPEYDLNVSKDIPDYYWRWQTSHWSANVGVGIMLVTHLQINVNYNFACDRGGHFYDHPSYNDSRGKFNSWQIGLALYI